MTRKEEWIFLDSWECFIEGGTANFDLFAWRDVYAPGFTGDKELELCRLFDDYYFTCDECEWTYPRDTEESPVDYICNGCYDNA